VKHAGHAGVEQPLFIVVGHDAADDHGDIPRSAFAQRGHQFRHDQVIGGERRDADDVDILLDCELDDGRDLLPGRRVDHFHARVAQRCGADAAATVVAVQADLGDQHLGPNLGVHAAACAGLWRLGALARRWRASFAP